MNIPRILQTLKEKSFQARLLRNGEDTGVTIIYRPSYEMEINGLGPELPPHLKFTPGEVKASKDGKEWLPAEIDFGIFRLLDPRVFIFASEKSPFESEIWVENGQAIEADVLVSAIAPAIGLDEEFLKETLGLTRRVRFVLSGEDLMEMIQDDIPPLTNKITVRLGS